MNQTMTQWDAFLQTICESPEDDSVRLIAADWLEENAWRVADGKARKGTTLAGDEAEVQGESAVLARASFIRVQVELARYPRAPTGLSDGFHAAAWKERLEDLRRRERELLEAHFAEWTPQLPYEDSGYLLSSERTVRVRLDEHFGHDIAFTFRRGFVAEISLTCADFAGGVCGRCNGTKRIRVTDEEALGRIRRRGGHPMVPPRRYAQCHACHGTGRTPGHAAALFGATPIEKVTLADPPHAHVQYGQLTDPTDDSWYVWFDGIDLDPVKLSASVFIANADDAVKAALPIACLRYGRAAAKGGGR